MESGATSRKARNEGMNIAAGYSALNIVWQGRAALNTTNTRTRNGLRQSPVGALGG